jgi:hypothetical protein
MIHPCPKPPKREKAPRKPLKRAALPRRGPPRAKPKKRKGPSVRTLRDKADALFSKIIRARDGECVFCGYKQPQGKPLAPQAYLQAAHYYGKKARPGGRYLLENVHAACSACHMRVDRRDPQEYSDWMRAHYPPDQLDALERMSRLSEKRDRVYYQGTIEFLESLTPADVLALTWPKE